MFAHYDYLEMLSLAWIVSEIYGTAMLVYYIPGNPMHVLYYACLQVRYAILDQWLLSLLFYLCIAMLPVIYPLWTIVIYPFWSIVVLLDFCLCTAMLPYLCLILIAYTCAWIHVLICAVVLYFIFYDSCYVHIHITITVAIFIPIQKMRRFVMGGSHI